MAANARSAKCRQRSRRAAPMGNRAFTASRKSFARAAQLPSAGCNRPSILPRISWPKTGAAPSVLMPMAIGARLTIVPKLKVPRPGVSTMFTGTPDARAEIANASACLPSRAPIAMLAPFKSLGFQARRMIRTHPAGGSRRSQRNGRHEGGRDDHRQTETWK